MKEMPWKEVHKHKMFVNPQERKGTDASNVGEIIITRAI